MRGVQDSRSGVLQGQYPYHSLGNKSSVSKPPGLGLQPAWYVPMAAPVYTGVEVVCPGRSRRPQLWKL